MILASSFSHILDLRKHLGWPKGVDDEVLHLILINSLGGPGQAVCCHAKMSRLA
jgi:hypothetical protein